MRAHLLDIMGKQLAHCLAASEEIHINMKILSEAKQSCHTSNIDVAKCEPAQVEVVGSKSAESVFVP